MFQGLGTENIVHRTVRKGPGGSFEILGSGYGIAEMRLRVRRIDADIHDIPWKQGPVRLGSATDVNNGAPGFGQLRGKVPPDGGRLQIEKSPKSEYQSRRKTRGSAEQ
jgi:hypothetical protein